MSAEYKFIFVRDKISAAPTFHNMFFAANNGSIRTFCRNCLYGLGHLMAYVRAIAAVSWITFFADFGGNTPNHFFASAFVASPL